MIGKDRVTKEYIVLTHVPYDSRHFHLPLKN